MNLALIQQQQLDMQAYIRETQAVQPQPEDLPFECVNGHLIEHVCMNPKCEFDQFICSDKECEDSYKRHQRCQFFILSQYAKSNDEHDLNNLTNSIADYYTDVQKLLDSIKRDVPKTINRNLLKTKRITKLRDVYTNKNRSEREGLNLYKEMKEADAGSYQSEYKDLHFDFLYKIQSQIQQFQRQLFAKNLTEPKPSKPIQIHFTLSLGKDQDEL